MEPFQKIATLENIFEGQMMEQILRDQQIPHEIRTYHDEVYGNLYEMNKGWGTILAPVSYKEQILELLSELRKQSSIEEAGFSE
ncbi:hypothetical protein [Ferviditalea candida]|uniref:DUF2007 domain-containing protein n=1 Tax=Ferviditalea candida TaxID=3108399 RepID=A0ABU5ZEF4_9BACL|nr:hypothetical protein [Paenibacillaceae bacterium T2]